MMRPILSHNMVMVMICIAVRSTKSFQSITFAKQTSSCYQSDADRKIANVNQYKSIQTSLHAFDTTSAFESINSFYSTQPYFAAFLTCGLKSSVADLLVQGQGLGESRGKNEKSFSNVIKYCKQNGTLQKPTIDMQQNIAFIIYGGINVGLYSEFVYNHLFPFLFGWDASFRTVFTEVFFDSFIIAPIFCLPGAYLSKGIIKGKNLTDGLDHYVDDVLNHRLLQKYWTVWIPAQFITLGVVPEHLRVVFITVVGFFWMVLFSSSVSSRKE